MQRPVHTSPPPSYRDCDNEECQARVKKLELVIQRNIFEIKRLRANNKEYMLQSSSQMLVQAIQTRRRQNGNPYDVRCRQCNISSCQG